MHPGALATDADAVISGRSRTDRPEHWTLAVRSFFRRTKPTAEEIGSLDTGRYIVVDVETSGLDMRRDSLISIGAVEIVGGKLVVGRGFYGILRQERGSSRENILVHGIGSAKQEQGEPPGQLLMSFLEYVGSSPLIAFHSPFDQGFLRKAIRKRLGLPFANPFLDLAWLLPGLFGAPKGKRWGLDDWLEQFGLQVIHRHSADADALAAAQLFLRAVPAARNRGLTSFQDLSRLALAEEQAARMQP
jgi:DNA polymerase-3 subunit epsilon